MKESLRTIFTFLVLVAANLLIAQSAQADLVLNLDTSTKQLFFTGTTTSILSDDEDSSPNVEWAFGLTGPLDDESTTAFGVNAGLDVSPLVPSSIIFFTKKRFRFSNRGGALWGGESLDFAGNGTRFSYNSDQESLEVLESLIGFSNVSPTTGFGGTFSIADAAAVPEPRSVFFLVALAVGFAYFRRRRSRVICR